MVATGRVLKEFAPTDDRPVADVLAGFAEIAVISHARKIEPALANVRLEARYTVRFGVPALARRVQFLDWEVIILPLHHVVDHFQVHLLAVALVADLDHLYAGVPLPLALELLDVVPAVGELHAMADAIEQVLVAALIDADNRDCGTVRALGVAQ